MFSGITMPLVRDLEYLLVNVRASYDVRFKHETGIASPSLYRGLSSSGSWVDTAALNAA